MIIYADVLIITNFIINYFLFRVAQVFSSCPYDKKRILISSLIGAVFSLYILLEIDSFLLLFLMKISVISLSVFIAFGFVNYYYFIKNILSLALANFILYGILGLINNNDVVVLKNSIIYLNINPVLLVLSVVFVWVVINIFNLLFNEKLSEDDIKIKISINGKDVELNAFYDTGFKIRDIINNNSVILVDLNKLKSIISKENLSKIESFFLKNTIEADILITPIFYSTVNGQGMLPAIKADRITLIQDKTVKEIKNCLIAISKEKISNEKEAIIGKEIFKLMVH